MVDWRSELSGYNPHEFYTVPTKGDWLLLKAEIDYSQQRMESALKSCDDSLATYNRDRKKAIFLKSKILFAMGREEDSHKAFDDGAYLAAEESDRDIYSIFHCMEDAALEIGIRKDPVKESANAFIETYAAEHLHPRIEHVEEVLNTLEKLVHMKAPNTVADVSSILESEPSFEINNKSAGDVFLRPNSKWRSALFKWNDDPMTQNELYLQIEGLYSCVNSDQVKAKFGAPQDSGNIYMCRSDPTALKYVTPDYVLTFTFNHVGHKGLRYVQIIWNDQEFKDAMARAVAAREEREAKDQRRNQGLDNVDR